MSILLTLDTNETPMVTNGKKVMQIETHVSDRTCVFSPRPLGVLRNSTHAVQVNCILLSKRQYAWKPSMIKVTCQTVFLTVDRMCMLRQATGTEVL